MSKIYLTLLVTTLALTLGACSKSDDPATGTDTSSSNQLLAYVPADTPYLAANLEPPPDEVIDAFLLRLEPVFDEMQAQLSAVRSDLEAGGTPHSGDKPEHRVALAILRELDGKMNRTGLESLGFDIRSHKVMYGMGAFPVFRIGLDDSAALRATVQRILDDAGISAPEQSYQGISYWRLSDEDLHEEPAGLYLSILEDHLAVSIFPPLAEAELLPAFLGLEMPAESDALARLAELNHEHGYTPYGSGILDLHKLADRFLQPDTNLARAMAATGEFDPASISAECVSEIHEIIGNTPRMTVGTTELTTTAVAYQYRAETPASLAQQLLGLVSRLPMADAHSDRLMEFAFGMRFGAVRDFAREKVTSIVDDPYQCEHLLELNTQAAEALEQLNQPMPPFINNFRGLRVSLSEILMDQESMPSSVRGFVALHVEKPEMFVGMAQMFLPDLAEFELTPGDPPVRLPETVIPVPGSVAYAAMSDDAIGVSLGDGEESGLPKFLDRKAGPEGMFLSASYDMAAYMEYSHQLDGHMHQDPEGGDEADHEAATEIANAARTAFAEMADRSNTTLRFAEDGLVIDGRTTFK